MKENSTLMHIVRLTVTLLAICAVVAAVLAGVNMITKDKIAAIEVQKTQNAIAQVLPNTSGLQQLPLSKKAADMIVGMHIHDAADALDHYAPCTLPGEPLAPYREYIVNSPIKVLELSGRLTAEEIITGTDRFVEAYGA